MNRQTDWDSYYERPYRTASYSRRITERILKNLIKKYISNKHNKHFSIAELGGANSCFFEAINTTFSPIKYDIYDNNKVGINKFKERVGDQENVHLYFYDVLKEPKKREIYDAVYSVGLIEHFSPDETKQAINTHLKLTRKGGIVLITFPTPTFLYSTTRKVAELTNQWIFHDERPLEKNEVISHIKLLEKENNESYKIMESFINWPIILTQQIFVIKK